ncbi:MAG: hypothetical protein ACOX2K_04080 [Bacillota bacterium]|jgi:hypothetical protein
MALAETLEVAALAYPTIFAVMIVFYVLIKLLGRLSPRKEG